MIISHGSATSAQGTTPVPAADQGLRAFVLHAGKAVQFSIPVHWHVHEVGVGRQVRLLVSPHPIDFADRDVADGLWFALEYHPHGIPQESEAQLREQVASSLESIPGSTPASTEVRMIRLDDNVAARMDFHVKSAAQDGATSPTTSDQLGQHRESRSFRILIQTTWCRCWIHAISPTPTYDGRFLEFERILEDFRLVRPAPKSHDVVPAVRDAESILGSWKAYASRMRLSGDGAITIATDNTFRYSAKNSDQEFIGSQVVGRFRAQHDVLFIEWEDNSKRNYRWRLLGDRLLMTDHEGRMSQLVRISE